MDKRSSLIGTFVNYGHEKLYNIGLSKDKHSLVACLFRVGVTNPGVLVYFLSPDH
jgi:hypothetical protein